MATIKNKTPRHKDYNLTVKIAKQLTEETGENFLSTREIGQLVVNPRTGQKGTTTIEKQLPSSIHFGPKETKEIPDAALDAPEIKAALLKGDLAQLS